MAYRASLPLSHFRIHTPYSKDFVDGSSSHYTSPNQDSLPSHIPTHILPTYNPSPNDLRNRIWADDDRPYLAFIYQSPLFGGAMTRFGSFGPQMIVQGSSTWHLPYDVAKSWKNFEQGLRLTAGKLTVYFAQTHPDMPCSWTVPDKPSLYGYFGGHPTQETAYESIKTSIDSFIVYSAYVSFLIRLCQFCDQGWTPPSLESLLQNAQIPAHPEWIQNLLTSGMGESDVQRHRLGVIVNPKTCKWLNLVPYMVKAGVPIWFYWGSQPFYDCAGSWISAYSPNPIFIRTLRQKVRTSSTSAPAPEGFPRVEVNSGQRFGELMEDFFKRRKEQNQTWEERENSRDRQARLSRKQSAASKACPGRKGPRVYRWENIDGYRIRTEVTRKEVEDWWGYYKSSQIRYDDFSNQYDCCSDFDDGMKDPYDSDDDNDWYHKQPQEQQPQDQDHSPGPLAAVSDNHASSTPPPNSNLVSLPPSPPTLSPPHLPNAPTPPRHAIESHSPLTAVSNNLVPPPASSSTLSPHPLNAPTPPKHNIESPGPLTAVLNNLVSPPASSTTLSPPDPPNAPTPPRHDLESADDILQVSRQDILHLNPISEVQEQSPEPQPVEDILFYRYGFSLDEVPYQGLPTTHKDVKRTFNKFSTLCCSVGLPDSLLSDIEQPPVLDFIDILIASTQPFHEMPGKYWDLSPANSATLARVDPVHFHIEVKRFPGQTLCLLHPQGLDPDDHPPWLLAVPPWTALECLRRGLGPHPGGVAEYLVIHGMAFRTLQRLASLPTQQPSSLSSTTKPLLGSRAANYTFDEADFGSYETFRDSYLRADPSARRALSMGGIVARLARESLPASVIQSGPSANALQGTQDVLICDGEIYVDDALSPRVMELICGTYEQFTGRATQSAFVSWFPKNNRWENSGYNIGHWHPECENWYLRRRANILENVDRAPLPATKWRDKVRLTRAATKILHRINLAALDYLGSSPPFIL